jgi:hypothetical protein
MSTKIKSAMALFFEQYPEFSEHTKECFIHIERRQIESAYFVGTVSHDTKRSGEDFFNEFYEN